MEDQNLQLIKKEILELAEKILSDSYPYCETDNLHLSIASGNINNNAHRIKKLANEIKCK